MLGKGRGLKVGKRERTKRGKKEEGGKWGKG